MGGEGSRLPTGLHNKSPAISAGFEKRQRIERQRTSHHLGSAHHSCQRRMSGSSALSFHDLLGLSSMQPTINFVPGKLQPLSRLQQFVVRVNLLIQ